MIVKEIEERRPHVSNAPSDFEDRACDIAIEGLEDIRECDRAHIYVKWATLPGLGRMAVPLLYVLFSDAVTGPTHRLPKIHIGPDGKAYPSHAICLAKVPSGYLMNEHEIRDTVRKGIEDYLRLYEIKTAIPGMKDIHHA